MDDNLHQSLSSLSQPKATEKNEDNDKSKDDFSLMDALKIVKNKGSDVGGNDGNMMDKFKKIKGKFSGKPGTSPRSMPLIASLDDEIVIISDNYTTTFQNYDADVKMPMYTTYEPVNEDEDDTGTITLAS